MIKVIATTITLFFLLNNCVFAKRTFVCFENDHNKNLKIYVCFDDEEKAIYVKYKGQQDSIPLIYKSRTSEKGPDGGIPAYYWTEVYVERYKGKITGEYVFTNANSLDVTYTRKKDKKEFYFTIPHDQYSGAEGVFKEAPCF